MWLIDGKPTKADLQKLKKGMAPSLGQLFSEPPNVEQRDRRIHPDVIIPDLNTCVLK